MTWPRSWNFLSMRLILIPYLNHAFDNIWSEFQPSGSIILDPRAQNVKTPNFDLWPDLDLTCDLNLKFAKWFWSVLSRAFECRLARLSTNNGSWDSGGRGVISPPPPQALKGAPVAQAVTCPSRLATYSATDSATSNKSLQNTYIGRSRRADHEYSTHFPIGETVRPLELVADGVKLAILANLIRQDGNIL